MLFIETKLTNKKISKNKYEFEISTNTQPIGTAVVIKSRKLKIIFMKPIELPSLSWVIDEIEIREGFRGNGNGTKLLKYVVSELQKIDNLPIVLMPPKSEYTQRILAWYKRHGFKPTEQIYWVHDAVKLK